MTAATLLVLGGLLSPALSASAKSLPALPAPAGFESVNNPDGGRILTGALPDVGSEREALHAGLRRLGGYFGGTVQVTSAIRSRDDQVTTACFRANLKGTPIIGISIIAFAAKGASRESILFDTASSFSKTLPALTARLNTLPLPAPKSAERSRAEAAPAFIPPLQPHRAPDNTIGISIPVGWKVPVLGDGRASVQGPNQQFITFNGALSFVVADSPRAARMQQMAQFARPQGSTLMAIAPFSEEIAQDYVNGLTAFLRWRNLPDPQIHLDYSKSTGPGWAIISGTRTDNGLKSRFVGTVAARNLGADSWMLVQWMMAGPSDRFAQDAPIMLAIEKSVRYNAEADRKKKEADTAAFVEGTRAAMAASKTEHEQYMIGSESRFQSSMAAARSAQDSIDRSAAGMIHYIQGTAVLEHSTTGYRGSLDANWAQTIAQHDPEHYQVVPMKDYVKGVDY